MRQHAVSHDCNIICKKEHLPEKHEPADAFVCYRQKILLVLQVFCSG